METKKPTQKPQQSGIAVESKARAGASGSVRGPMTDAQIRQQSLRNWQRNQSNQV